MSLENAREQFLNMVVEGSITEEPDGDEGIDLTCYVLVVRHDHLSDLLDALEVPPANLYESVGERLNRALLTN
jgi:hypothetical protein